MFTPDINNEDGEKLQILAHHQSEQSEVILFLVNGAKVVGTPVLSPKKTLVTVKNGSKQTTVDISHITSFGGE